MRLDDDGTISLRFDGKSRVFSAKNLRSGHLELAPGQGATHTLRLLTDQGKTIELSTHARQRARALLGGLSLGASRCAGEFDVRYTEAEVQGLLRVAPLLLQFVLVPIWVVTLIGLGYRLLRGFPITGELTFCWGVGLLSSALIAHYTSTLSPPLRRTLVGHDGLRIQGRLDFLPWGAVVRCQRSARGIELTLKHNPPLQLSLRNFSLPTSREESEKDASASFREMLFRYIEEARRAAPSEPPDPAARRALLASEAAAPAASYRQKDDGDDLWRAVVCGDVPPSTRVAAVRALAAGKAAGTRERLEAARRVCVEPSTRAALDAALGGPAPA